MSIGVVVWFTGLPSSGKSSLAERVRKGLYAAHSPCIVLDGDAVRETLVPPFGYRPEDRLHFYETLARLAALLASQGFVVLVAATAHRQAFRDRAHELAPRYLEVLVDTPAAECAQRDTRGLYREAEAGRNALVPGMGVDYERPRYPHVVAEGGQDARAASRVVELIRRTTRVPSAV
jgi:adenylylsulfate kinase